MASKRKVRRKACTGKIKYELQKDAEIARNFIFHKNPEIHHSFLNVYKCKFCGSFHVGHLNRKQEMAKKYKKLVAKSL